MPQRILGLDIGTWSVKGVLLEDRFRGFSVIRTNEVQVQGGEPETLKDRQSQALQLLLDAEPEKVDAYISALPGERASVRFIELPYSDTRKVEQTIDGELADVLPFDIDDAVFDHELVEKLDNGGSRSIAAAARSNHMREHLDQLDDAGVDPKHVVVDTLALYNLYTHFLRDDGSKAESPGSPSLDASTFMAAVPGGPPEARLLIDIGHERTLICAAGEKGIEYVRAVRTGGADITRKIESAAQCTYEEAETIKHEEGFVASGRHPAPDERAQQLSDITAEGLALLVREIRRSLLAIRSDRRVRISRIDLLGGGSRIRNLANYLADQLNVPTAQGLAMEQIVERDIDQPRRPAFALALAAGMRSVGDERVSPIDLRVGEFQFAGQLVHLKSRLPAIGLAAAVLLVLVGINVWSSYRAAVARESTVDKQFCNITKDVIGREICEPKTAIDAMKNPATELGNLKIPSRSALNIAAELSARIPEGLDVHIREMQISPTRAKMSGETTTFDAVDQIVSSYQQDPCYTEIKKGKLRRIAGGNRIEFLLSIKLECS